MAGFNNKDIASGAGKKSSRKGKGNKDLEPIRTAFRNFVEKNLPKVQQDFEAMKNPKDRLYYIATMAEYCIPKLKQIDLSASEGLTINVTIGDKR